MNLIDVAAQASAIVTLTALFWLSLRAFGKHAGWGLAVLLFSPLGAAAFARKYWKECRKPLTVYAASLLVTLVLALYLFNAWGGWDLIRTGTRVHQGMQVNELASRDASNFLKANLAFTERSGLEIRNIPEAEYAREYLVREAVEAARQAAEPEPADEFEEARALPYHDMRRKVKSLDDSGYRLVYLTIDVSEAYKYIGSTVKVTRRNVVEKEYRLTGVSKNRLKFAQRNRSGNFSFSFRSRDIEKLRVLVKQPG
jgi:hypothetical protein